MDLREIPGFPNYSVTMGGRVWSKTGRWGKGRWLKLITKKQTGYICVDLFPSEKPQHLVHCLVLETYVGPCPEGMECRHLDGVRAHNYLDNLCWGTRSENQYDRIEHGTNNWVGKFGEKNSGSKLSNQDRRLIIYQYSTRLFSQRELGKIYGVHQSCICRLVTGKVWPFVNITKVMGATA